MKEVCFPKWADEVDKVTTEIYRVTAQITNISDRLAACDIVYGDCDFKVFWSNVVETLDYWTGNTYVGQKKEEPIRKAFQVFFQELYKFLMFCQSEDNCIAHPLRSLADKALYQGKVYRYLGHCTGGEYCKSRIEPEYDGIYVSWSKTTGNQYIQSKLYGTKTLLTCNIVGKYYGIDLKAFDVVKGAEAEVVFPTIKDTIIEVEYIEDDEDMDE